MAVPADLSLSSENILKGLSFNLIESADNGMSKYYLWANEEMKFSLTYDRGYYDCDIAPYNKPINSMALIKLLRFLKNDKTFYKQELINANLWYTLTVDEYVELFHNNYKLIKNFIKKYNPEKYDDYNKFECSFEGLNRSLNL